MTHDLQATIFTEELDAVHLVVYGNPAPQGSKKFVGTTANGRGLLVESSKKVKPWRMDVKAAAELVRDAHAASMPLEGPLVVSMIFTLPKPSSAPKRRQTWPDRKPDVSKLARSTEDALTDAGFWADDARVVFYEQLGKVYPGEHPLALSSPGVRVSVRRLDQNPPVGNQPRFERGREGMEPEACESAAGRGTVGAPALATLPPYASPVGGPMGTEQPAAARLAGEVRT